MNGVLVATLIAALQGVPASLPASPDTEKVLMTTDVVDGRPWPPPGVFLFAPGSGIVPPMALTFPKPVYTRAAMEAKITGDVHMEMVVGIDGLPGEVRIKQSLDSGLDAEAVKAVKASRFKPGTKDGAAVPVLVNVILTFNLTSTPRK